MNMTTVYAGITKTAPQDDGTLMVYGKATGSDLDLDQQRCDPEFLKRAMPEWFKIGNVREQHDSKRAVGKATEHESKSDGHWIKAHIVDPVAITKTKAGVYTGFSIGIMRPRVEKSTEAPNGVIMDGSICEVSLVDRPAYPSSILTMCKAAKPGMQVSAGDFDSKRLLVRCEELTEKAAGDDTPDEMTVKLGDALTPEQAEKLDSIADGAAVPAIDSDVAKAALGKLGSLGPLGEKFDREKAVALVTETLTKAGSATENLGVTVPPVEPPPELADIKGAKAAIAIIAQLIVSEASDMVCSPNEDVDIQCLLQAVAALRQFIHREHGEPGSGLDAPVFMGADADLTKVEKYSLEQKRQMLKDGKALKNANGDPSYPIGDKADLRDAILAVGRGSGDHNTIRTYIKRRAAALGATNMLPENWTSDGSKAAEPDAVKAAEINVTLNSKPLESVVTEIVDKATEPVEKATDTEITTEPVEKTTEAEATTEPVEKTPDTETTKAATVEDTESDGDDLVKALSAALEKADSPLRKSFEAIVEASTETTAKSLSELGERLVKVEQMAVPGGPALRRTENERNNARKSDLAATATRFKALASHAEDPDLRRGYAAKAAQIEAEIKALVA